MIKGNLNNFVIDISSLPEKIKNTLRFLQNVDFSNLSQEKRPIVDGESFIFWTEYSTKNPVEKNAESHQKTVDIHYMISGQERIGIAPESLNHKAQTDYNEADDYTLYDLVENEEFFSLETGEFMIIMPGEIHRTGCSFNREENVKKVIVKIKLM